MGATKIMIIRHAERPDTYTGVEHAGVDLTASMCGEPAKEHLTTLGWERAGALVTLFAPPWGPKPGLATPQFLFASKPESNHDDSGDKAGPSQRPYETLLAVARKLDLNIDTGHSKKYYPKMVGDALKCDGVVLIAWQHEDIPLTTKEGDAGISREILTQTGTESAFDIPAHWPEANGTARYDLVLVFDRPTGEGPITGFKQVPQQLLAGDLL